MSESEKNGFFAKIFGNQQSSCCNIRIEEVPEDDTVKTGKRSPSPCCGTVFAFQPDDKNESPSDINQKEEN